MRAIIKKVTSFAPSGNEDEMNIEMLVVVLQPQPVELRVAFAARWESDLRAVVKEEVSKAAKEEGLVVDSLLFHDFTKV